MFRSMYKKYKKYTKNDSLKYLFKELFIRYAC